MMGWLREFMASRRDARRQARLEELAERAKISIKEAAEVMAQVEKRRVEAIDLSLDVRGKR